MQIKNNTGGCKASYLLQNKCRKVELWDWKTRKILFGMLVISVVLYGCELWGRNVSNHKWWKRERIQKYFITTNLKVKSTTTCEILLVGVSMLLVEASTIIHLLSYFKKVEKMDIHHWPRMVVDEELDYWKKTWKKQNKKWFNKWNINYQECLEINLEIKKMGVRKNQDWHVDN